MVLYGEKANKERRFIDAHYFAANQRSIRSQRDDWALKAHHSRASASCRSISAKKNLTMVSPSPLEENS